MAMSTKAYDTGTAYRFEVHLDTTQVLEGGSPDPAWVNTYEWGKEPPAGQTVEDYLTNCKREAEALAALDPRLQPAPQPLPI